MVFTFITVFLQNLYHCCHIEAKQLISFQKFTLFLANLILFTGEEGEREESSWIVSVKFLSGSAEKRENLQV